MPSRNLIYKIVSLLILAASCSALMAGTLTVYLSPPSAQSTTVSGVTTETFNSLSTGVRTTPYVSAGVGTYTGSSTNPMAIAANNVFGGANNSKFFSVGSSTNSINPVNLTLSQPAAYFGFWWSAGDQFNRVDLFQGTTLFATFSTQDLLTFLNNGVGNVTAISGATYQTSAYFGNPNISSGNKDAAEPFVYVSFAITGATIDKLAFYNTSATGSAFESDNHSVIFSGSTVTIPTTFVQVETLNLTPTTATPAFIPVAGTYTSVQSVTITSATSGATIRYTTDGTTPSQTVGTLYSAPVSIGATQTLKAIAYKAGLADSAVASGLYTINLPAAATPTFSPVAGTYTSVQNVTISSATSGASIRYTTDGSTPSQTVGTLYSGPVSVGVTQTIKAIAYKAGFADSGVASALYTINLPAAAQPTFSPAAGTYTSVQNVTITSTTSGASIRYTTDGSTPSDTVGTLYSTPVSIGVTTTLKAIAYKAGMSNSTVRTGLYTINLPVVATPTFSPVAGTYTSVQNVTITSTTSGNTIRYTTDGSTPSQTVGTVYSTAVPVNATTTIKAIAYKAGMTDSAIASALYTINLPVVATPTFSPVAGTYTSAQNVTITSTTSGNTIRYTTDGSTPSQTVGTVYSTAVPVNATTTIKAIAYKAGMTDSTVASALYTIAPLVDTPTFDPVAGTYTTTQNVAITSTTSGASIRYTTDGSTPTQSIGTLYSTPVAVSATTTIKAIAYKAAMTDSTVATALYTIAPLVTTPTFDPVEGTYTNPQTVTITSTTAGASIRYTTDGSTPTSSVGTLYSAPVAVSATMAIKAIAYKAAMTDSTVATALYTIAPLVATPDFSPVAGTYTSAQTVTITSTTSGTSIRYTTDGSTPTASVGTLYSTPVAVSATTTIKAIAYKASMTDSAVAMALYTIAPLVATPDFSPVAGTYTSAQTVTITSTTSGTSIRYTTDGSTPTSSVGTLYSAPVAVSATTTIKAIAYKASMTDSAVAMALYTIAPLVATPVFDPVAGTYTSAQTVAITTTTSGASIRYTTDGSTPTSSVGTLYSAPVAVSATTTIKAIAYKAAMTDSTVASALYTIAPLVATPTFDPVEGTYTTAQTVAISTTTSGTSIRYTTDGSTPTSSVGTLYSAPVAVSATTTIKAIAYKAAMTDSAVATALYTIAPLVVTPTFSPVEGTYTSAQTVTISTTTSGASIRYTTDGSTPTSSVGTLYSAPVAVGATTTIKAIAYKAAMTDSAVATAVYTIPVSVTVAPPAPTLTDGQTQQFTATVINTANTAVTWSIAPAGTGTISVAGLYTAPATVTTQQTVTVTATSQADPTKTGTATITLALPVTVSPASATLVAGQTQQFTATVTVAGSTAVTWSVTPAGSGTITTAGLYTAPFCIASQQTATVTATSVADPTKSASVTLTLQPATTSYSYFRTVTIDHTKVPNTDQANFPFLFKTTAPAFATTANGGHVTSANGYDIFFSSDPSGSVKLDHELEQYNPVTGQVTAWVRIPALSHTTDTTLYVFYGNSGVTTSLENKTGVWDSNYGAVWHLGTNGAALSTTDSTSHANNATVVGTATATTGQMGGGAALTGSPNYIDGGNNASVLPTHTGTFSIWVKYSAFGDWTTPMGNANTSTDSNGATFWNRASGEINFEVDGAGRSNTSGGVLLANQWHYLVGGWDGSTVKLYKNGTLAGSVTQGNDAAPAYHLNLGADGGLSGAGNYLNGILDEARVSNIARSADWIATEYNNQSSPATFYTLNAEGAAVTVSPLTTTLGGSQTRQFTATVVGTCNSAVTWSLSPAGIGTITTAGLYTAPATVATQQNVSVIATSVADATKSGSATVTLALPVTVTPATVTLVGSQSQQFTATLPGGGAVTWSVSPAGTGIVTTAGLYTAPACIIAQQTVTVTATSVADPTKSASATVTLQAPTTSSVVTVAPLSAALSASQTQQFTSNSYGFFRTITIDHNKVPNTDQANFPFLFSVTDPAFATTANGGQVTSANGYDIIFSSDPSGAVKLDHELEKYNPATGEVTAWVRIPVLSHTTDTTLYVLFGNSSITSSLENKTGVWDGNYKMVQHLAGAASLTANDSTSQGNNATSINGTSAVAGKIGVAASLNGTSNYIDFVNSPSLNNWTAQTISTWIKAQPNTIGSVARLIEKGANNEWTLVWNYQTNNGVSVQALGGTGGLVTTSAAIADGTWHKVDVTISSSSYVKIYVDGVLNQGAQSSSPASKTGTIRLGSYGGGGYFYNGLADELRISTVDRSPDWIATEFNNQNSPSTFFTMLPTVVGGCSSAVTWSLTPPGAGTVSATGLYTAPASIATQQVVTVTATSVADGTKTGSAAVTLLAPVNVNPATANVFSGETKQFTAVVTLPNTDVTWTISPSGVGSISASGLYTAPSCITTQQTITVTATSVADPSKSGSSTVTLKTGSAYSYRRAILIDHNKVPNTDQASFPFLFKSTDPALATTANGGHVTNANGYDIIFSSDPSGAVKLDHELEQYNPVTGQVSAWVRLPALSHTTDTLLYVFYGNSAITTSLENKTGVWDSNYKLVQHLPNGTTLTAGDSTTNGYNGTIVGATATAGQIGGAAAFASPSQHRINENLNVGNTAPFTYSAWINPTNNQGQRAFWGGDTNFGALEIRVADGGNQIALLRSNQSQDFISNGTVTAGVWSYVVVTINAAGVVKCYINSNGAETGTESGTFSNTNTWVGGSGNGEFFNGKVDEARISNIVRSPDWIAAEYNNQSSPSTFYTLYPENTVVVVSPAVSNLYASQTQQMTALTDACTSSAVTWSIAPTGIGSITAGGLYTAPATIASQQILTVTATLQADPTKTGTATLNLFPPVTVTVAPTTATLTISQTQQFTPTVTNTANPAVTWSLAPAGVGTITPAGLYTAPATLTTSQTVVLTATSVTDNTKSSSATITLLPFASAPTMNPSAAIYGAPQTVSITSATASATIRYTTDGSTPTPTVGTIYSSPLALSTNTTIKAIAYGSGLADSTVTTAAYTFVTATGTARFLYMDPATEGTWQGLYGKDGFNVIGGTTSYPSYVTATPSGNSTWVFASSTTDVRAPQAAATGNARVASIWYSDTSFDIDLNLTDGQLHQVGLYLLDWDTTTRAQTITVLDTATNAILDIRSASNYNAGQHWVWTLSGHVKFRLTRTAGWNAVVAGIFFDPTGVTVAPATTSLSPNQTQQFTTIVTNSSNYAVTWSVSPNLGTVSSAGVYTAPASVATQQTVNVIATSVADPTKSGYATVTLLPGVTGGPMTQVINLLADAICRQAHIAPTVDAGLDQYTTLSCPSTCSAQATVTGSALSYNLQPGFSLTYGWNLLTGPAPVTFATPTSPTTSATFTVAGVYTLQLNLNDGIATSSAVTRVYVNPANANSNGNMSLWPAVNGPMAVNTPVTLQMRWLNFAFGLGANAQVQVTVTGANARTATVVTNNQGVATYTYSGSNPGTDTITVVGDPGNLSGPLTSNPATVTWITAPPKLTTSPVTGRFFAADGSGVFNTTTTQTPAFTQNFPGINFDPIAGSVPGNTSGVTNQTRPFTDIVTDRNGAYAGAIVAQGNGYRAGAGPLYSFSSVFTGTLNVPSAGQVTFTITSDDAFILGIGAGATRVSGPQTNTPATTAFQNYAVMGGVNQRTAPTTNSIVVNFPAAGAYPYELDYAKGGDNKLTLTLQASGAPIPAASLLTLAPTSVGAIAAGQIQQLVLTANDPNGVVLPNLPVTFTVAGQNAQNRLLTTDGEGKIGFAYAGSPLLPGLDTVQAAANVNGVDAYSNAVVIVWNTGVNQAPLVSAGPNQTVSLPGAAVLNGSVSDDGLPGSALTTTWSVQSGPAAVTFDDPTQAITAANFSVTGTYVLKLTASDGTLTSNSTTNVSVNPVTSWNTGWILNPIDKSTVTGLVPVMLIPGITLTSGTLSYYPADNTSAVTVLNASTTGSGQIGTFDTTTLNNGSYWIQLNGTNSQGATQNNLALVTVAGEYKPGRVTATVMDLVVPAPGLAIQIQRVYDSLLRNQSGDFGFGWNLGIKVDLKMSPTNDVTLTISGQRKTFYFTPPTGGVFGFYYLPQYTAELGLFGSLTTTGDNCSGVLVKIGNIYQCAISNAGQLYQPTGFVYTDPYGRVYTTDASGNLQSLRDLNNNTLTVTPTGITSSTGLAAPFVRDAQGRIIKITDPLLQDYIYHYNANGELDSVTLPSIATPIAYTYDPGHFLHGGTDARSNPLPSTTYDGAGRLQSVTDPAGKTTTYTYNTATRTTTITYPPDAIGAVGTATMVHDAYGKLTSQTDPLSHTTTNVYDPNHTLQSTTDALGHTTTYTYDSNGNQTSVTYPQTATSINRTSSTTYNQFGLPTTRTDELGKVQTFTYDTNFNLVKITDVLDGSTSTIGSFNFNANGTIQSISRGYDLTVQPNKATSFVYDQYGNRISQTAPLGRQTTYTYNNLGQLLTTTPPLPTPATPPASVTTTNQYDPLGRLTLVTAPMGKVTTYTYDNNGNKLTETVNGQTTSYQYDAMNRVILITYPTTPATTMSYTYDFRGNVIDATDQSGHVTHNEYDLAGRLVAVTKGYGTADASRRTIGYDNANRKISETDANNHTTTYNYDEANRLISLLNAKNQTTSYVYDDAGNRISMTDPNLHTTQYQYDVRRRLRKTIYHDTTFTTQTYDGAGRLASVTDQASKTVNYNYDDAEQLVSVVQANHPNPANNTTVYTYDPHWNLKTVTDANNHTTTTLYDLLDRPSSRTLPGGGVAASSTYDVAGNQLTYTDFLGKTTTDSYDGVNRLTSKTPDPSLGELAVSFTYTGTGKRSTMTDASGMTTYTYDNQDRLKTKATPQGTLTYTYDSVGNVASINSSNANGASVNYTWDELNRLASVIDNRLASGQNTTTYTYDPASNLATVTYPNGVQSTFTYDTLNRLTSLPITKTSTIASYTYGLGPAGDRQSLNELGGRSVTYTYDGIYRLTNETISSDPAGKNGSVAYGLDPVGNRLSQTSTLSGISTGAFTYDPNDRLSTETYDNKGNTLVSGARTFIYDFAGRLKDMNNGQVMLVYDGDGNRVTKIIGATTRYLVDDLNPTGYAQVMEELVNGSVQRTYTYGTSRISQNQFINAAWTASFYGYDGIGSIRLLTNPAGVVTDTYDYDAWGNAVNVVGSTPNVYRYVGEQYDPDLGLYYLRARYFNPLTGRFLTRDPVEGELKDPATFHKYLYVGGDPINYVDPSGQTFFSSTQIKNAITNFEAAALRCGAKAVAANIAREGLYLLIADLATDVVAGQLSNVYVGRTIREFAVRFAEHKGAGKVFYDNVRISLPANIVEDRALFAKFEQLLMDQFGGKAQLANQINASAAKLICD